MNTFMGIEIGKRAIVTHQVALDVTGHNISNANTAGYSRQAANIVTSIPWHSPVLIGNSRVGQLGTGSEVADIQRYRDSFIDKQIRNETRSAGYWQSVQEGLAQIEGVLNEPNEEGLRGVMDKFWQSWQDLSANPESEPARAVVKERAAGLAESFNHAYRQLKDLRDDVNNTIEVKTEEINAIANQIRDLNRQIMAISMVGKQPNDLLDKRDLLIDQLSGLADIQVYNEMAPTDTGEEPLYNGMVNIMLGGRSLVQGGEVCQLAVEPDVQGMNLVIWADTRSKANINGGQLKGLLDIRGKTSSDKENAVSEYKEILPNMINELNSLARTIIERTNDIHRNGYNLNNKSAFPEEINFFSEDVPLNFDGNWARFMQVDARINEDVKNIAAASNRTWNNGAPINFGDGSNALKIAQLKHDLNQNEIVWQTTSELDGVLDFPSNNISGYLTINYRDEQGVAQPPVSIYLAPPDTPYQDIQQLVSAIREQLKKEPTLLNNQITVDIRCDGSRLNFYSNNPRFTGVDDGHGTPLVDPLLGGMSFSLLTSNDPVLLVQGATTDDFWRKICGNIGVQSQEAQRMVKNQDQLLGELENKRQSLSGVSLDEEMTSMIKFQHAYNAASRFITTMDEQLNTIINGMGLVGR